MKIFLLEDDFSLNKIIANSLRENNYFVDSTLNGYKAAEMVLHGKYDIYLLDLNVAGFDGLDILTLIRKNDKTVPVIIISSEIGIDEIKKSFDFGCNDYIKKPFHIEELLIRIAYHLPKPKNFDTIVDLGFELFFDLTENKLVKLGNEVELTYKEKLLLSILVQNINQVVSIDKIHEYVWNGKAIESVSMRTIIHKLNKKLDQGMIVNIRGTGYKLLKKII